MIFFNCVKLFLSLNDKTRSRHQTLVTETPKHCKMEMSFISYSLRIIQYFKREIGRKIRLQYSAWAGKTTLLLMYKKKCVSGANFYVRKEFFQ